jgi:type III secretory pathway component EscV
VNDRHSPPIRGLAEDERLLLSEGSDELAAVGAKAKRHIVNPVDVRYELAVVDAQVEPRVQGLTAVTTPAGFAALLVYREIVANAYRLLGTEQTLYLLQDLRRRAPELVQLVLRHFTIAEITQLLRALVRERIPPRLLPVILERLTRLVIHPIRRDARTEFVRRGLSQYLVARFASGDMARNLYTLSPELEAAIAGAPDEAFAERFRDAVWSTLRKAGDSPIRAGIVVRKASRRMTYGLLAPELPELGVFRRSELGANAVEPRASILLSENGRGL